MNLNARIDGPSRVRASASFVTKTTPTMKTQTSIRRLYNLLRVNIDFRNKHDEHVVLQCFCECAMCVRLTILEHSIPI